MPPTPATDTVLRLHEHYLPPALRPDPGADPESPQGLAAVTVPLAPAHYIGAGRLTWLVAVPHDPEVWINGDTVTPGHVAMMRLARFARHHGARWLLFVDRNLDQGESHPGPGPDGKELAHWPDPLLVDDDE